MPIEIGGTTTKGAFTSAAARKILNDLDVATCLFDAVELQLYKAGPTPNTGMAYGDFTECDFSGYASVPALTFSAAAFEDGKAILRTVIAGLVFDHNGGGTANDVKGWLITDTAGTTVLYAEDLDAPKTMSAVGDQLVIIPQWELAPTT